MYKMCLSLSCYFMRKAIIDSELSPPPIEFTKLATMAGFVFFYYIEKCVQNVRIFFPKKWGIECERIRWRMKRTRRVVPWSILHERMRMYKIGYHKRKRGG